MGRVGGDELRVVAPKADLEGALALGERIRSAVEGPGVVYADNVIPVTQSVGFAVDETGLATGYDQLIRIAAEALCEAKAAGRNRCVVHANRGK